MERLQKYIANTGYCSRRKAEELIKKGLVKVNGEVVIELGTKVSIKDQIMIKDKVLTQEDKVYYLLYKPRGVVTTVSDDKKRKTVIDLIGTDKRIYPVGRLDYDTSGLLLLTNDGQLTNLLTHPKNKIEKVYLAKITGFLSANDIRKLETGIILEDKMTSPCKIKIKRIDKKNDTSLVQITIHEGRNHQVKNMFLAVGHQVLKLKREKIGFLDLVGLKSGEYRKLTVKEVKKLYSLDNKNA